MWRKGNNNYAEQSGRREFSSTLNGAPTYTYITIQVIIYSLLIQNPTKGTNLNNGRNLKHNSTGKFRNARSSSLTSYKLFFLESS